MKITAQIIAKRCQTSVSAVSRAFQPDASIAPELRAQILEAARSAGYAPPRIRRKNKRKLRSVSLVVGDIANPYYPTVIDRFTSEIAALKCELTVHTVPFGETVDRVIPQVLKMRSDAVVVASAELSSSFAKECEIRGIPVVLFNRIQAQPGISAVCTDNYNGGRLVAEHLVHKGCRKIVFVGGMQNTSTHLERRRGFLDALAQQGTSVFFEGSGQYEYDTSHEFASNLFGSSHRPDGIFCANDITALAVIDAAKSQGLVPGRDVAIVGFDDIPMAAWGSYRLTTVRQRTNLMVRNTLDLIEDALHEVGSRGTIRIIPSEIIHRDSG